MEPTPVPANDLSHDVLRGSCLCGKVVWSSVTMPIRIAICHCVECRKASGNPFLAFGLFHNDAIQWQLPNDSKNTADHPNIQQVAFTEKGVRGYCRTCGSPLFIKYHCRPDGINIPMGLIDDDYTHGTMPPPLEHIFLKEMAAWWTIPQDDGLDRFDEFNGSFQRRLDDWVAKGRPQRDDVRLSTDHAI